MHLFSIASSSTINTDIMNTSKHEHLIIRFFADMAEFAYIHFFRRYESFKIQYRNITESRKSTSQTNIQRINKKAKKFLQKLNSNVYIHYISYKIYFQFWWMMEDQQQMYLDHLINSQRATSGLLNEDLLALNRPFISGQDLLHQIRNVASNSQEMTKKIEINTEVMESSRHSQNNFEQLNHPEEKIKDSTPHHDELDQNSHYLGISHLSNHSWFDSQADFSEQGAQQARNKEGDSFQNQVMKSQPESENQMSRVIKNQTKNIPKNYGKAIIAFIQKQPESVGPILARFNLTYEEFIKDLYQRKKSINTIANLRDLWIGFKYAKCFRMITNQFLRKHALNYIFNSRISNYNSHVKYRKRLQEAVEAPELFKHIKQY